MIILNSITHLLIFLLKYIIIGPKSMLCISNPCKYLHRYIPRHYLDMIYVCTFIRYKDISSVWNGKKKWFFFLHCAIPISPITGVLNNMTFDFVCTWPWVRSFYEYVICLGMLLFKKNLNGSYFLLAPLNYIAFFSLFYFQLNNFS